MDNLMEKFAKANITFSKKANQSNLTLIELSQAWVVGWTLLVFPILMILKFWILPFLGKPEHTLFEK